MFDLMSTAELTVGCAIVAFFLSSLLSETLRQRILVVVALTAWFCLILAAGATGALARPIGPGIPGIGIAVMVPIALLTLLVLGTTRGRALVRQARLSSLVGVHSVRVLGITFVMLYWAKRLPAPFAPTAGWGDVLVGLLAIPLALTLLRNEAATPQGWVRASIVAWSVLGLTDLVTAVALGAMSAPGPLQIFHGEPSSAIMTNLPWILIPCFLVPTLAFLHVCTLYRLRALAPRTRIEDLRPMRMAAPNS